MKLRRVDESTEKEEAGEEEEVEVEVEVAAGGLFALELELELEVFHFSMASHGLRHLLIVNHLSVVIHAVEDVSHAAFSHSLFRRLLFLILNCFSTPSIISYINFHMDNYKTTYSILTFLFANPN
ncbi:hypothetical protein VNO78_05031 [Psophocarpus tetragonolobus]|uniref:Uncharacterized protein n=1 Tax=Psophocarpus tetragonolobus TaxID=3891 RepID=A0AAN9XQ71_PSOTE